MGFKIPILVRGLKTEMGFGYCCDGGDGFVEALIKWGFGKWGFGDGVLGLMEKEEEVDKKKNKNICRETKNICGQQDQCWNLPVEPLCS